MVGNMFALARQAKSSTQTESELLASRDKKTGTEVQNLARSLRNDWKLGIGAPPAGKSATTGYARNSTWFADVTVQQHELEKSPSSKVRPCEHVERFSSSIVICN